MIHSIMALFKSFFNFCKDVLIYFIEIDGSTKASALAYVSLVSIVPFLVLGFGFFSSFPSFAHYADSVNDFLFHHLIPSSASAIRHYLTIFMKNSTNLSVTSLPLFLASAAILIFTLESVFNTIWKVHKKRKGLQTFLIYWAIITMFPLLSSTLFALSTALYSLPYLSSILKLIAIFTPFLLSFIGFLFLFILMPNHRVKFRHGAIGALFSALTFEVIKYFFKIYSAIFTANTIVYGVLAVIPFFLLWLYLCWLIVIIGGVITYKIGVRSTNHR